MFVIIILLIASMVLAMLAVRDHKQDISGCFGLYVILGVCCALGSLVVGCAWHASGIEAKLINEQYQMNYTQEEIFWASNVIDVVLETKRQRIEVTGNVFGHGKP